MKRLAAFVAAPPVAEEAGPRRRKPPLLKSKTRSLFIQVIKRERHLIGVPVFVTLISNLGYNRKIMFEKEQQLIETKIKEFCAANDIPLAELKWQPIPFSGEWGFATSFFQTAANEARAGKGGKPVPQRAQEMAEQVKGSDRKRGWDQPH